MLPGHEYKALEKIQRILLRESQNRPAKELMQSLIASGQNVHIEKGTIVSCLWLDVQDNALLEIVGPETSPFIGRMFISSPRTQHVFELNI